MVNPPNLGLFGEEYSGDEGLLKDGEKKEETRRRVAIASLNPAPRCKECGKEYLVSPSYYLVCPAHTGLIDPRDLKEEEHA